MAYRCYGISMFLYYLAATSGCAPFAHRPPTPAKDMDVSKVREPQPDEHFYATLFASQSEPKIPHLTHSFATVVRVVDEGAGRPPLIETSSISWLPASLNIDVWKYETEKGVNLGLRETLEYVLANGERVSQWGPFECQPELYYRFLVQKEFLETGRVGYQAVDELGEAARTGDGCDCIHALTDMDPRFSRGHYPLIRFGDAATQFIVDECRRHDLFVNPARTHAWVNEYLGLDSYPIIQRR